MWAWFAAMRSLPMLYRMWFVWLLMNASVASAQQTMPALLPLPAEEMAGCGCSFGQQRGQPLLFWSWEGDRQSAVVHEQEGLRTLTLRSEKYLPTLRQPARAGDRMALQFARAGWSIQTASEVTRTCSARARQCAGTDYRSRIVLQWQGKQRKELDGWAHCACSD
ncbi:hypothetical protein BGI27_12110 [Candidatus Dactylopiibacterium carminicum]|nr:hypothetical protein BGI27_12110 [Candidatus Dactylopiibacterium carminicum]PAS98387.1 MAG: hypothetical protein BSR46_12125 [Candidatus Dactylopiibacterium carminicum]